MGRAMKIREGDEVQIIGGKDSGKSGRVTRTEPKRSFVYVEGLNMVKRHEKPRPVQDAQRAASIGGIVDKEGPIHVSNVMLLDPKDNKPTTGRRPPRQRWQTRALLETERGRRSDGGDSDPDDPGRAAAAPARALRAGCAPGADETVRLLDARWRPLG